MGVVRIFFSSDGASSEFFQGKAKSGEISFYPFEIKKTFSLLKLQ